MPSPFAAALTAADEHIDGQMAENISIVPMKNGDFSTHVDTERDEINPVALVDYVEQSSGDIAVLEARVPFEEVEAEVRRALLPDGAEIRKNDEVLLLDRPGSPRYKVGRVDKDDPERILFTLSKIRD